MSSSSICLLFAAVVGLTAPLVTAEPAPSVAAIAALTDPAKLATLSGERSFNMRLHKVLAWLEESRRQGVPPSKTIDEAQRISGDGGPHGALVKEMLLRNFEYAERAALFSPDNLARMKSGHSPLVLSGTYAGQPYEVDHVIPVAEFPALGNEVANLIYLPRTQNRRKGDSIKQRAIDLGQKFVSAGLITPADYEHLKRMTVK